MAEEQARRDVSGSPRQSPPHAQPQPQTDANSGAGTDGQGRQLSPRPPLAPRPPAARERPAAGMPSSHRRESTARAGAMTKRQDRLACT